MAASVEGMQTLEPQLWLPSHALACYEGNTVLRSWLCTPGLLTERVRAAVGPEFRLRVLEESRCEQGHLRRIELGRDGEPWIYAETRVPAATLARYPWLADIGSRSLGEALSESRITVRRSEPAFAAIYGDAPLVRRALELAALPPQALWVRRSMFLLDDCPFALNEVFLPIVAQRGADTCSDDDGASDGAVCAIASSSP
jgi:chorismate-pyruvate lyase